MDNFTDSDIKLVKDPCRTKINLYSLAHPTIQDDLNLPYSLLDSYRISGNKCKNTVLSSDHPLYTHQQVLMDHITGRYDLHIYGDIVRRFFHYLNGTEGASFTSTAIDTRTVEFVDNEVQYVHRWTTPYRKGILAKLYQLEEWYEGLADPGFTMLSLTTYHDTEYSKKRISGGYTIPQAFRILNDSSIKIRHLLKEYARRDGNGTPDYIWIVEPQLKTDSGYPHRHWVLFEELTQERQEQIRRLWSEKYLAGEQLQFTVSTPGQKIKGLKNYLMKYLGKTFTSTGSKFDEDVWSPGEVVFNAVAWHWHYRLFGASQDISKIMAWKRAVHCPEIEYFTTQLKISGLGDPVRTWTKPGYEKLVKDLERDPGC